MNFLFYVGIILPTVITITLFVIFIYCWFLQKARKEVLTKKYDPHGKMRRLGMSMNPPPPPRFCLIEGVLLSEIGEDNIAYDVSRSPSTEQDGRGRPMYHTYHDSGISAGLSPSQESEPRRSLAYRTCPDSGISGLVSHPSQCSSNGIKIGCNIDDPLQRQPYLQQLYGDDLHINSHHQHHHQQYDYQQPLSQSVEQLNQLQASINHKSIHCYNDDLNHLQSPLHNNALRTHPTSLYLDKYNRQTSTASHVHNSPARSLPPHQQSIHSVSTPNTDQNMYENNDLCQDAMQNIGSHPLHDSYGGKDKVVSISEHQVPNKGNSMSTSVNFLRQLPLIPGASSHQNDLLLFQSPTRPQRHSYRDSEVMDISQTIPTATERPDSQASQSSTTDSEDSGFRSSYCAAHHNAVLNKQGNPLLKHARKTRTGRRSRTHHQKTTSKTDNLSINHHMIMLSPQNLELNVKNSTVIGSSTLTDQMLSHRSPSIQQQCSNSTNSISTERVYATPCASLQCGVALTLHDGSPTDTHQQVSTQVEWPTQSNNDKETVVKQNIDLADISTHLSWNFFQNMPSSNKENIGLQNEGIALESCHQVNKPAQNHQTGRDKSVEMYGYSVV